MAGAACFDAEYYAAAHPDLLASIGRDPAPLWRHYEAHGMAEGRAHRWRCGALRDGLLAAPLRRLVRAMAEADPALPSEAREGEGRGRRG